MDLPNDGIASDPAEFGGDLAGGKAVRPELLQQLNSLVGPVHRLYPPDTIARPALTESSLVAQQPMRPPSVYASLTKTQKPIRRRTKCRIRHLKRYIWRDSGARVATGASTCSWPLWTIIESYSSP